jgi:RNA polymerase sigma-70 factor (ECF subfamily)
MSKSAAAREAPAPTEEEASGRPAESTSDPATDTMTGGPAGVDMGAAEDLDLVLRAQQGELACYDELLRRYQERIYATIYHMTSNHEDAGDLTQEAFIKAYQAIKSFKGDSSFYTWVYRIAVNKTINFLKTKKNKAHLSLNDLDFNAEHDPDMVALVSERTPRRDLNLSELQERLNAAMMKLSEIHRLVVTLHDIQGLSHEEIGKIMDCNVGTVRSRLFYARQQLQAHLADYLK